MQRMQTLTTASLLPTELLILAGIHENQESERYRLMALRFLPFSTGLSRLMKMLALECEQRVEDLALIAERLQFGALPGAVPAADMAVRDRHFFIVDEHMASQALFQALGGEQTSLDFYRQLQEANATPQLDALLAGFVRQKHTQAQVIEESLEQLQFQSRVVAYRHSA